LLRFSFDILNFLAICSRLLVQKLGTLNEELFGKKCESATYQLHSALCTFTVLDTFHIRQAFYSHFTHQHTVSSVACNKLKTSRRKW